MTEFRVFNRIDIVIRPSLNTMEIKSRGKIDFIPGRKKIINIVTEGI